jgi:LCP family protein required for cell wall assembly
VALVLAVVTYTGFRVWSAIHKLDPNAGVGNLIGLAAGGEDTPGTLAYKIKHGERVNILLLGYGGAGHDGSYLTDSIMVLSLEGPNRVAMTSIPRDSYVNLSRAFIGNRQYQNKINVAYEIPLVNGGLGAVKPEYDQSFQGAGRLSSEVIGDYLGQPIDYWVGVDFSAFKRVVDAVGGVDVINPYTLDDDTYPQGETGGIMHIHFNQGPLHLDGDQALIYVRERHADSDFGRSRRQQQVLAAVKQKALSVGAVPKLLDLLGALADNVKTNMSINDLKTFATYANRIDTGTAHRVSIDNTNFQFDSYSSDGAYILLPRDHTLTSLHEFVANELPDPAALAEGAKVQFSSSFSESSRGQSLAGIAGALARMAGYAVTAPDTVAAAPATTQIHDYSGGRDAKTLAWLQAWLGGEVVTETPRSPEPGPSGSPSPTPSSAPVPGGSPPTAEGPADIVVVLGADFAKQFNNAGAAIHPYVPPAPQASSQPNPAPSVTVASAPPSPSPSYEPPRPSPSAPGVLPSPCVINCRPHRGSAPDASPNP